MKRILVIGANGMAGHVIYLYFKKLPCFEVFGIVRTNKPLKVEFSFDVSDFQRLDETILFVKPDFVINCVGVLNTKAENAPDTAILLNSYLPHYLARRGEEWGFKLIHISTDCVFKGTLGNYNVCDIKDGVGFYAETKALGEVNSLNHLTLRTSIVGPEINESGIGLFQWFMKQNGNISGFSEVKWTGITTTELVLQIQTAINENISGIHHVVPDKVISKFDLLNIFKKVFEKDGIHVLKNEDYRSDKSLMPDLEFKVKGYDEMVAEMKKWMDENNQLYPPYYFA